MKFLFYAIIFIYGVLSFAQTAPELYNKACDKISAKDYKSAIELYDQALKIDPNYVDAYYNRGLSKMYLQDYKNAIEDLNKAIELKSDFVNAYSNRAISKIKLKDIKGAILDFDKAISLNPKASTNYFMRGQAKMEIQDVDGACADLNKAKSLGETRAEKFLAAYCKDAKASIPSQIESLMIDWPDAEGWKVASNQENSTEKIIELLRNNETFDNWTEIGTMIVYKNVGAALNIPLSKTVDFYFENAKKACPAAKLTIIDKEENVKYPSIIFKIEQPLCPNPESQVWFFIQGTDELFVNFRAIKQNTIPSEVQDKWVKFFKTAKIVTK